jgi:hypothetical protein
MPTRKQRRRREKELRHEWEEVYVDSEGRELEPDEVDELVPERERRPARPQRTAASPRSPQPQSRGSRGIQAPSWRRVLKRGAIFAPLMYVFLYIVSRNDANMGPAQLVAQTALLLVVFLPFSYLMDTFTYRLWKRRQAGTKS